MNCFDEYVDRTGGVLWLKGVLTPQEVSDAGLRGFSGAEFEFPTCPAYSRGVAEAAQKGLFGFTLAGDRYKSAVQWWMQETRGYDIDKDWIVPTQGTIFSLATTIRMVTEPGDNIIVLTPGYNRYEQAAVRLNRGCAKVPLTVDGTGYRIDFDALACAMAEPKNKLLVVCNPNNPTGSIWPLEDLRRIEAMSCTYGVYVFCDEIFAEIAFEGRRVPSYTEVILGGDYAIVCTAMGKAFSLTGVNHANVLIPNAHLRERYIAQRNADHYGSLDPMVHAGLLSAYTEEGKAWVRALNDYVWQNYLLVERFMQAYLPGAKLYRPQGTYVIWVDYQNTGYTHEVLDALLRRSGFLGDWGEEYYGGEWQMRYSIACPQAELKTALTNLKICIQQT